jgi:hypothetical protein
MDYVIKSKIKQDNFTNLVLGQGMGSRANRALEEA